MQIQHIFFIKNQQVAIKFYITDMGKLVFISLYFLKKNLENYNFLFLEVLLTRFLMPKTIMIQSHISPFVDFYYIINSYPLVSMGLMG